MNLIHARQEKVAIVDDDEDVRDGYAYAIEGSDFVPVDQPGPLGSLDNYLAQDINADSAVSDHRLRPAGYAHFDGALLVAAWYSRGFPALLCTTYGLSSVDMFRSYRRWIPVVLSPDSLSPDTVGEGLDLVRDELAGRFSPVRKPRRALVNFVDYTAENQSVYVKLPAWSSEALSLRVVDLPLGLRSIVTSQVDYRCYAQVNLATDSPEDLYISEWEFRS